jgi:hypothetical protein
MPMIDVYAAADLFPADADRQFAEELTAALLRAEGVASPGPTHTNNTGAYIDRLPPSAVNTAAQGNARTVRVPVLTPPGALGREAQKQLVAEVSRSLHGSRATGAREAELGRSSRRRRGSWGIARTAFGREEFAALATRKK